MYISGVLRKSTLQANIRLVLEEKLNLITSIDGEGMVKLGVSLLYNDKPLYVDINELCSNHLAIFGIQEVVSHIQLQFLFKVCFIILILIHIELIM